MYLVVKSFECDVCKQGFATLQGMKIHRGRHAREANKSTADNITSRKKELLQDHNSRVLQIHNELTRIQNNVDEISINTI